MPRVAAAVAIDTVLVGDAGNPSDPVSPAGNFHFGAVSYEYRIGKTEVTNAQYVEFLNAVAVTSDPYRLWPQLGGISGTVGSGGTVTWKVQDGWSPNWPVYGVSWASAARFVNWLQNGQPIGPAGPGTTETGAYTMNSVLDFVTRNPGATWFLPTINEWYKAALYQPAAKGGDTDGY